MNFKLKQIESIDKKHYKGKVFDLTVEKDHSYNIQGIIVHNSICTTRIQTGHGVPGLQTIFDCARSDRNAKIIADGGLKNSGDIVRLLLLGLMLLCWDRSLREQANPLVDYFVRLLAN